MSFEFKTTPRAHQLEEFERFREHPARALLWQMRTGKSKAVIDNMAWQFLQGRLSGAIVIAPNGVHANWVRRELQFHCPVDYDAFCYNAIDVKTTRFAVGMDRISKPEVGRLKVLAINAESVRTENGKRALKQFLTGHTRGRMLIVDESHNFRTPGSSRTIAARALARKCSMKRILTGTAVHNNPLAAYSQFQILKEGALGFSRFEDFKARYAVYKTRRTKGGRSFEQLDSYQNLDELQERVSKWASVVLRRDCEDMPKLNRVPRVFEMTPKQERIYARLKNEYMLEDAYHDAGARLSKLQQISRGWYYDESGGVVHIMPPKENPALQMLKSEIIESECKVIVWAWFKEEIKQIVEALREEGIGCVEYHGGIKDQADRTAALKAFERNPDAKVFVSQPVAGGSGLDLSTGDAIIWYSHTHDFIYRDQADERASAVGKTSVDIVDFTCIGGVDNIIMEAHRNKREVSDFVAGVGLKNLLLMEELI